MKQFIFILLIIPTLIFANPNPKKVNWISFEKAVELNKTNPKPILIDVYTDWCGFCHKMDATTYQNEIVVNYINDNYYAVKFDAEQKETVNYKGKSFKFIKNGRKGVHEFAYALLNGKLSYPSTVFFNKNNELVEAVPGYLKSPDMEKIITYMGEEIYLTKDWKTFDKEFKSKL